MAVLLSEAYNAGFDAGAKKGAQFDTDWTNYNVNGFAALPVNLKTEFKKGWSSALSYRMDAY